MKMDELIQVMERSRPDTKPRGLVLKFRTCDELYRFTITRASRKT